MLPKTFLVFEGARFGEGRVAGVGSLTLKIAPIQILGNPFKHPKYFGTLASKPAASRSKEVMNASRSLSSLMPGCCPAVATFAFHCPTVLL